MPVTNTLNANSLLTMNPNKGHAKSAASSCWWLKRAVRKALCCAQAASAKLNSNRVGRNKLRNNKKGGVSLLSFLSSVQITSDAVLERHRRQATEQ